MLCLDASFLFNVIVARLHPEHASMWERWLGKGQPMVALPIQLVDDAMSYEAFALARKLGLPASYDTHYVTATNRHGADLWTSDERVYKDFS